MLFDYWSRIHTPRQLEPRGGWGKYDVLFKHLLLGAKQFNIAKWTLIVLF